MNNRLGFIGSIVTPKNTIELDKIKMPCAMVFNLWRMHLKNAVLYVLSERRYLCLEECQVRRVVRIISHVFSFQSISSLDPKGFPLA